MDEKNVVLGVTGGIAVYKAAEIVRGLYKENINVHVIMTRAATKFVSPLTFQELSQNPVAVDLFDSPAQWHVQHIALAARADVFLIAPATANVIGKVACGIADDLLTTTVMATRAPVVMAPAMNTNMLTNHIVQANIAKLRGLGYHFIEPATGELACGTEGAGRLPDPSVIVTYIVNMLSAQRDYKGKTAVVTAGGTREPIDPVRYIGNRSSGKMGYALAAALAVRGAKVILISGPTVLSPPANTEVVNVETAAQMYQAVIDVAAQADIIIKAAAVADFRPQNPAEEKIKKRDGALSLVLERTPDILWELGQRKVSGQILVGFAAETQDLLHNAQEKLAKKNLDMIVANDITQPGAGFDADTNVVRLLYRDGKVESLPLMSKRLLADAILDRIRDNLLNPVAFCQTIS